MTQPKISVVLPLYNGSSFLPEIFQMLADQTFMDFELVAFNDGSRDNTDEIFNTLRKKASFDSHLISENDNKGVSYARNQCLRRAKGIVISFLDQDDLWFNEKLNLVWQHHRMNDNLLSFHWELTENQGQTKQLSYVRESFEKYQHNLSLGLCRLNFLSTSAVSVSSSCLSSFRFNENLARCSDYDFWLSIRKTVKIIPIQNTLGIYRIQEYGLSRDEGLMRNQHRKIVTDHLIRSLIKMDLRSTTFFLLNLIDSTKSNYFNI